ncbi:MAG: 3-methyl-2-oxobutanoate hydroxymethyltransferase [Nitrospirae bacterium]|nr:3-methyl-2-oxobutanoate hydroxymethyltransferase [Nitrospirota bacterium]
MMTPITIPDIIKRKSTGKKITMLTAYDYLFAGIVDEAGIDIVLVGDSLGTVVQGHPTTIPVTMDEMIYHTKMVKRGIKNALVVGDMPFLSYQTHVSDAVYNAGRFLKEGGAAAVKAEGGINVIDKIKAIITAGIPVMGHVGMLPQTYHQMGGYKVQGKEDAQAESILNDAILLEEAGAFAIVIEGVPEGLAKRITDSVSIPTIGIGAGVNCDGQVLVLYDLLGLLHHPMPKFVRKYADLRSTCIESVKRFKEDVESGRFPGDNESYH